MSPSPPHASLRRPELTEQPPQRLPRAGLGKVAPTQLCGLGGCGSPLGASGRGRALRRVEDARVTRGGRAAEPGVRAAPPLVVTPRSGAAEPPARAPLPVRLPGTQPRAPEARPGSRGRSPPPRAPPCLTCAPPSVPPSRPRAPRRGTRPPRAAPTGRRLGPRRAPPPPFSSDNSQQRAEERGRSPGGGAEWKARRLRSLQHRFPSVVRAAPRKCHQRPFRSAPHFRPEPQSSAHRARAAAAAAGTRRDWRAAGSEPRSATWRRGRAQVPSVSAGSSAVPARRGFPGLSCGPSFCSRDLHPETSVSERAKMPGDANRGQCLTSTGIRFPSAAQYSPTREAFPMEAHDVQIAESLQPRGQLPSLATFPREPTAPVREPLVSNTRTNVLFKFRRRNGAGLAASAPPAGETVLQGTRLRHRTLQTPQIPPLQSHSLVWRALGRVTQTNVTFADPSLKWAQGTCWTQDLERMGRASRELQRLMLRTTLPRKVDSLKAVQLFWRRGRM